MDIQSIQEKLLKWYLKNAQSYPWREEPSPYHVWISEIMLQQTRIEAALPYYQRFIAALPNVQALAEVPQDELLKLWEGLGYYSRAKNLQKAARIVMCEYNGDLPPNYEQLLSLPGIGAYTAGAIASIAFGIPVPAVDGNVMRVLSRLTNDDADVLSTEGKKHFSQLAASLVPDDQPGAFNQALMELGETVCLPNALPRCSECPLCTECEGAKCGTAADLPRRIKKSERRVELRNVVLITAKAEAPVVLIHRRDNTGLLGGMWEFPNTMGSQPLECVPDSLREFCRHKETLTSAKHLFSHIEWRMQGHLYYASQIGDLSDDYRWATAQELETTYPIPGAFRAYKKLIGTLLREEIENDGSEKRLS